MTTTNLVRWRCLRCSEHGTLPVLDDVGAAAIRSAIERGHERRAPGCHLLHDIKHVRAEHDGKTIRFGVSELPPRDDGPETVAGREVSRR